MIQNILQKADEDLLEDWEIYSRSHIDYYRDIWESLPTLRAMDLSLRAYHWEKLDGPKVLCGTLSLLEPNGIQQF